MEYLINHDITSMSDASHKWPIPNLDAPKLEILKRVAMFKRKGLLLLYQTADCAVGLKHVTEIREKESVFIESLDIPHLATLGIMVEVLGQGFFTMTKQALHKSGLLENTPLP